MMCSLVFREKLQSTSVESLDTRFQQKQYMSTTLNLNEEYSKNPEKIIQKLETFAKGILHKTIERHFFNNKKQEDEEKLDEFLTNIKVLSGNCDQRYPLAEQIDWATEKAQKGISRLRKDSTMYLFFLTEPIIKDQLPSQANPPIVQETTKQPI